MQSKDAFISEYKKRLAPDDLVVLGIPEWEGWNRFDFSEDFQIAHIIRWEYYFYSNHEEEGTHFLELAFGNRETPLGVKFSCF